MPSEVSGADQSFSRLVKELQRALEGKSRELADAREQQAATAEILAALSNLPSDPFRVFAEIAVSAARLCDAHDATIFQVDGNVLRVVAHHGVVPQPIPQSPGMPSLPLVRGAFNARAVLDQQTIQVLDLQAETDEYPEGSELARRLGHRTVLAVPLIHAGTAIGSISMRRTEARPFTDRQVEVLKVFADQAVIAMENTRLFEEVQAKTHELQESLHQQTATADVLKVIGRSTFDIQTVLDTLVESAARLSHADRANITRVNGERLDVVAFSGFQDDYKDFMKAHSVRIDRGSISARSVIEARIIHVHDVLADPEFTMFEAQIRGGFRTGLAVPLLRERTPIGAFFLTRPTVDPFTQQQIDLVQTFADQAVIAIENTRLFEAEQTRTRELTERTHELTEALEYQTATSDVLAVISRSKFDLQPTLDAIAGTASRLCGAADVTIFLRDGGDLRSTAHHGHMSMAFPYVRQPIARDWVAGRTVIDRKPIHVHDLLTAGEDLSRGREIAALAGHRTTLGIPLLREGAAIGCIVLRRAVVNPFAEKQITILQTFADQAVIAIENTRLFEEVQARNRDLTALREVGRAVSSTLDLKVVLKTIVDRAVDLSGTDAGSIFYYREEVGIFELGESTGLDDDIIARLRKLDISGKEGGLAEAIAKRQPLQIPDLNQRPAEPLRDAVIEAGFRASLIVPLLGADGTLGTLILRRRQPGEFSPSVVTVMQSFADQSVIALENARLFEEIAHKSRELEIASQHKSQFVANMSHELRTPLAAMLGYAELLQEGIYGAAPEKFLPILTRIRSNGKHLLGLINTVLDISKIEAGQFKLNLAEYALGSIVETVMVATESLAATKKLAFKTDVARELPYGLGDEQRLTQVLLNLVGNAIKFTDSGEVRIAAKAGNGHFIVSVSDTGPGIPPEECERVFEKFRQVDSSNTRAKGGTGLGLAIAREIVEMHGGRIWVESTLGQGSTFRMELPVRAAAAGAT